MRKTRAPVGALLCLLSGAVCLVAGCGDDDCPTCPDADAPPLYAIGMASVSGDYGLDVHIDVYDVAGSGDCIDEAHADDLMLCVKTIPYAAAEDGHQVVSQIGSELCPSGVIPEFHPEATTVFTFTCGESVHTAELHLLDRDDDVPGNLAASVDPVTSELSMSWDAVAGAEWYSVRIRSQMSWLWYFSWDYLSVPSPTATLILPYGFEDTGYAEIYVAAGTGPMPDDGGREANIAGDVMTGTIYSMSDENYLNLSINPAPAR